jgi:hypothetical protein
VDNTKAWIFLANVTGVSEYERREAVPGRPGTDSVGTAGRPASVLSVTGHLSPHFLHSA